MKLGYWGLKGRAFPIRCLLHYSGIEFEDKMYFPPGEDWFGSDKPGMKTSTQPLPIPSIPYIQDGETTVFQSIAVLKFAGRKAGLFAKDEQGKQTEDILQGVLTEVLDNLAKAKFAPENSEEELKKWCAKTAETFNAVNDHLSKHKFLCGDLVSWIDFMLFHMYSFMCFYGTMDPNGVKIGNYRS